MKKGKGQQGKKGSIGTRLSAILGLCIVLVFLLMSLSIIYTGQKAISSALDGNLNDKATMSMGDVQKVIASLESISSTMEVGVQKMNEQEDSVGAVPNQIWKVKDLNGKALSLSGMEATHFQSRVVDAELSASRYNTESMFLDSLNASVAKNPSLLGTGIFFEPNGFQQGIKEYGIYMTPTAREAGEIMSLSYDFYSATDWYKKAKETGNRFLTDAYADTLRPDIKVMTMASPMKNAKGEFIGCVMLDINVEIFSSVKQEDENFKSLHTGVLDHKGTVLYSMNPEMQKKSLEEVVPESSMEEIHSGMEKKEPFLVTVPMNRGEVRRVYFRPMDIHGVTLWTMVSVLNSEFMSARNHLVLLCTLFSAAGLAILIVVSSILIRKALHPLKEIAKVGESVAEGDFAVGIRYENKDEIGDLCTSIQDVVSNIQRIITDLSDKLKELSQGNFCVALDNEENYPGAYRPLLLTLQEITGDLDKTMSEIKNSAGAVNSGAGQVSSAAQGLSQGATEQASSIEQLSATMNDISVKIKETADMAVKASVLSGHTGEAVERSNKKMSEMSKAMLEITQKSNEINKIIKTIDDIAFQTNILSLNAAIEAARAGAAGKGFAVVADEVGNLAQKSAKAAQNTATLIEETILAVEKGAKITEETAESLGTVSKHTVQINSFIQDISTASEEEAKGVSQISAGIEQISATVQNNSATAEESAAASEELSRQANLLNNLVSKFRLTREGETRSETETAVLNKTVPDAIASEKQEAESKKALSEKPKEVVKKAKEVIEKPKEVVEKAKEVVEKPKQDVEKPKDILEKPKQVVERPKEVVEKQKQVVEKPKEVLEKQKQVAEKPKEKEPKKAFEKKEEIEPKKIAPKQMAISSEPVLPEEKATEPIVDISGMDGMDLSQIPIPGDAHYLASQTKAAAGKAKEKTVTKKAKQDIKQERKVEQFPGAGNEKY